MAKKKFYAVAAGRNCGIFEDWASAERQVKGFSGAQFKSFSSRAEAEAWLAHPVYEKKKVVRQGSLVQPLGNQDQTDSIVVFTDGGEYT
jgi:ribonuclease HI